MVLISSTLPKHIKRLAILEPNSIMPFIHEGESYALIADAYIPSGVGYQAQSFAVKTQCTFLTEECTSWYNGAFGGPWRCSENFLGYLPNSNYSASINPSWALAGVEFFQGSGLTQKFSNIRTLANPVYIGAWGLILGFGSDYTATSTPLLNYTDFLEPETPGLGFILGCSMTAYDLDYVWHNGSLLVQQMVLSNTSLVGILTTPFVVQLANLLPLGQTAVSENTPSEFLDS
jgi:hypothetical protein